MADRARLAAAGILLALTLAGVPLVLPLDLAKADPVPASGEVIKADASPAPAGDRASPSAAPAEKPEPPSTAVQAAQPTAHTVASGESLWTIAQDAGTNIWVLADLNHISLDDVLHPGQVVMVPPRTAAAPAAVTPAAPAQNTTAVGSHIVAAGESLWGIAQDAGVRVETLADANNLSLDDYLHPGQILAVPSHDPKFQTARPTQGSASGSAATVPLAVAEAGKTPMLKPSDGRISSRFGWRIHPIFGTREFHTGIDIASGYGTPVRAARTGIVRFVGWLHGYGRIIIVDHGQGLETSYSHLSQILVWRGEGVEMGQILGRIGSTGWSTGPHLLFEVRRKGVPIDPFVFLNETRRLSPAAAPAAAPAPAPAPASEHRSAPSTAAP
ncbi:MAG: LysM peptidoglycan-binding domain-containing protein [Bacillati bacterium ANGP1]|uniref:LysM peptidoglycan-binding domain-containing protein n=1 Tax=Candidatus Segetimicrobium genomatis TaxID=2569760 RepID=A0A537JV88_9BACT|nr:MAG: LysM peptidoglycan-binding domain-containing protein [Terrabacteria group bacterium ANGP1]